MTEPRTTGREVIFVVDTDKYAGNFERPLVAFMSGQVGECEVGREEAAEFKRDHPEYYEDDDLGLLDTLAFRPDKNGCSRPAAIWTTPGYFNDGHGNHWPDSAWGTPEVQEAFDKSTEAHRKRHFKTRWAGEPPPFNPSYDTENYRRHPAFLSVAMFLQERPSEELLELFKKRAAIYLARPARWGAKDEPQANIIGFRLIEERTVEVELQSWPAS